MPNTCLEFYFLVLISYSRDVTHHGLAQIRSSTMPSTSTTLTSWALLIWKSLQARGLDSHSIFKEIGLDSSKLGDGNARYRLADMTNLWQLSLEETGDPCFGIEVGNAWAPTTFHALGFSWLASNTLKDGLVRLTRYSRIVNNSLSAKLEDHGTLLHLIFSTGNEEKYIHSAALDAGTVAFLKMYRMLCGESFSPIEMNVTRKRSECADKIEQIAGISINYDCASNSTIFDSRQAEQRLATGSSELAKVNEDVAMRYLNLLERSSIVMQVNAGLIELMPSGQVSEQEVVSRLNLSVRTLQRKLSDEQTSFSVLYKAIRKEMANAYIQDSRMSLTEISYLLGFSEQANFTRAYRRWFGTAPSVARQNIQNSHIA